MAEEMQVLIKLEETEQIKKKRLVGGKRVKKIGIKVGSRKTEISKAGGEKAGNI